MLTINPYLGGIIMSTKKKTIVFDYSPVSGGNNMSELLEKIASEKILLFENQKTTTKNHTTYNWGGRVHHKTAYDVTVGKTTKYLWSEQPMITIVFEWYSNEFSYIAEDNRRYWKIIVEYMGDNAPENFIREIKEVMSKDFSEFLIKWQKDKKSIIESLGTYRLCRDEYRTDEKRGKKEFNRVIKGVIETALKYQLSADIIEKAVEILGLSLTVKEASNLFRLPAEVISQLQDL
jgi:hypothetical protein